MPPEVQTKIDPNIQMAESIARLAEALAKQGGGLTAEQFAKTLENERKAINPSNPFHPGISAFSYPEGDRARPKPQLAVEEFYENNVRLTEEQLTPEEIDSYNAVVALLPRAGDMRSNWDGRLVAQRSRNGRRVLITFPTRSIEDMGRANEFTIKFRNLALIQGEGAPTPSTVLDVLAKANARIAALEAQLGKEPVHA